MKYVDNKVVLIGTGAVGMAYAFAVVNQGLADELVLIDLNERKSRADVLDLNHGEAWAPHPVSVSFGDYSDCRDAAMVVICAGVPQKPGQTRLELLETNLAIFKDIVGRVMDTGFDGIFLVATNPVDILTYATWRFSGLPSAQVIGSGTTLDTARLRFNLAQHFEVATTNVHATIIGEHGDSELPAWSAASIAGRSITRRLAQHPELHDELDRIFAMTRDAAYDIIDAKGSTSYGVGMALARITRAIMRNEKVTLPVSALLQGEYGHEDLYIGVPTSIGRRGIRQIVELDLDESEQIAFDASVASLQTAMEPARAAGILPARSENTGS
ncbi:L-lactate dehydrogenase [Austwickia chelonae]|uniref:L-lactate dehydrogenase n=1 Tax=Austwickia chelonae NBRC 105200 TaxID=1184607 RepID=K6UNW8_9MICO|nr:L-lactate dehydrogenase [Austwickia chelonae]GAB79316.1 L-lactate dehydrogenase [Austwickia chelonae NBRC 105200]SEW38239.1 L-lactate dehydrogenase [Austwickia chelonae]